MRCRRNAQTDTPMQQHTTNPEPICSKPSPKSPMNRRIRGWWMKISRVWAMPNKWTFTIKPIKQLLNRYVKPDCGYWADPFAGENSPAQDKNDLSGRVEYKMDALDFLRSCSTEYYDGILFDPPYSITQARQCYEGRGMDLLDIKPTSMQYWSECKNQIKRILKPNGIVICCGWNSMGLGKNRGFEMIEILLVPHGGSKNDTIVTVETKALKQIEGKERK